MSPNTVFERDPAAVTRIFGAETVIVPVRGNVADLMSVYTLNDTGTFLWELCNGQRTVAELVQALVESFDVPPGDAWTDAEKVLEDLRNEGLLREAGR